MPYLQLQYRFLIIGNLCLNLIINGYKEANCMIELCYVSSKLQSVHGNDHKMHCYVNSQHLVQVILWLKRPYNMTWHDPGYVSVNSGFYHILALKIIKMEYIYNMYIHFCRRHMKFLPYNTACHHKLFINKLIRFAKLRESLLQSALNYLYLYLLVRCFNIGFTFHY